MLPVVDRSARKLWHWRSIMLNKLLIRWGFKEPPPPPKPKKLFGITAAWTGFNKFIVTLATTVAALAALYGYVKPDFTHFDSGTDIGVVYQTNLLAVIIDVDRIPNVPVTVEYSVGDYVVAHRHYAAGLPQRRGYKFAEGKEQFIEPIPVNFQLEDTELTVRFVFNGWETLGIPKVFVFKSPILVKDEE